MFELCDRLWFLYVSIRINPATMASWFIVFAEFFTSFPSFQMFSGLEFWPHTCTQPFICESHCYPGLFRSDDLHGIVPCCPTAWMACCCDTAEKPALPRSTLIYPPLSTTSLLENNFQGDHFFSVSSLAITPPSQQRLSCSSSRAPSDFLKA